MRSWGPLTSELVTSARRQVEELLETPATEDWLSELHEEAAESRELYRDPVHGFLLLAHAESPGLYRPPHDHGTGWVIYAVQRGETEMGTYVRIHDARGKVQLVKRDSSVVGPGRSGCTCLAIFTIRGAPRARSFSIDSRVAI